jgi:hypothetical protein
LLDAITDAIADPLRAARQTAFEHDFAGRQRQRAPHHVARTDRQHLPALEPALAYADVVGARRHDEFGFARRRLGNLAAGPRERPGRPRRC